MPNDLPKVIDGAWERVRNTVGYLSEREARFLMAAVATAPAHGANIEIGSFKGRSTVGLAEVVRHYGLGPIVAVDPHTSPSETDPDLRGNASSYEDFVRNLQTAGVRDQVDIRRMYSYELAKTWTAPIRFLWVDGDHTYEGAKADIDLFKPYLADGAIIAMHDVLGTFDGSLRVFVEEVLDCDDFGPAGFHGSIGWAQYRPRDGKRFRMRRQLLAFPARRLIPVARRSIRHDRQLQGWNKFVYKIWRPLAPHGDVNLQQFVRMITPPSSYAFASS